MAPSGQAGTNTSSPSTRLEAGSALRSRLGSRLTQPVRVSAKLVLKHFAPQIKAAYGRSELVRRLMKAAEARIRNTLSPEEYGRLGRRVGYATHKAERMLGYRPRFSMAQALPLTAAWLRESGFVQEPPPAAMPAAANWQPHGWVPK
jgi:hypothetical protein